MDGLVLECRISFQLENVYGISCKRFLGYTIIRDWLLLGRNDRAEVCMYIMTLQCDIYLTSVSCPVSDNIALSLSCLILENIPFKLTTVRTQAASWPGPCYYRSYLKLGILREAYRPQHQIIPDVCWELLRNPEGLQVSAISWPVTNYERPLVRI